MREGGGVRLLALLAYLLIAVGLALRLIQYFANRSIWYDEAMLVVNIVERSYGGLLQPLELGQVAPLGFLFTTRALVELFGSSEYVLRLLPLLAGCASLFLFLAVARRLLAPVAALLALALFALSPMLIYYASEVKQYSTDVLIALVLFLLAFETLNRGATRRRFLLLGGAGAVGVWFSQPSIFIMAGLMAGLGFGALVARDWRALREQLLAAALYAASAGPAVLVARSVMTEEGMAYQQWFWRNTFMPLPPTGVSDLAWFARTLVSIFLHLLSFPLLLVPLAVAVTLAGCVAIWRRSPEALLCLLLPAVAAALASGLRLYPFNGRVLLFLVPSLLLLLGAGAVYAGELLRARGRWVSGAVAAALLLPISYAALSTTPRYREEIRPPLEYLLANRAPGDEIYVFSHAANAFRYYAPRYGLSPSEYRIGEEVGDRNPEVGLAELDAYREEPRTWVLFSRTGHAKWRRSQRSILGRLDSLGVRVDEFRYEDSSVYLYDLRVQPSPSLSVLP